MAASSPFRGTVRFGVFEVDLTAGELRRQGVKVHLQQQPFQVLTMLLERPGAVVTREELQKKIWPSDTFVDFDVGLGAAVYKLRQALGDSAESPRYVETLARRGYRFVAPTTVLPKANSAPASVEQQSDIAAAVQASVVPQPRRAARRWLIGVAAVLVVLGVATIARLLLTRQTAGPPVIAVLPLKNLSPEPNSDYFSDGLTDEIIRNLSLIDGVQVKSRTSSFVFKDKPRNLREVGTQLGANLVIEGSVLRAGDKLRIDVQLIRAADDVALWSGRYDRQVKDVFAIQDEISRSIVNQLRLKIGGGQRRYNTNVETYDLYLRARSLANERVASFDATWPDVVEKYQAVIAKDPSFAPAYAGLAVAISRLSHVGTSSIGPEPPGVSPEEATRQIRTAAEKALQLDPLLPEAYQAMGLVYARDLAWDKAEAAFRRALQLNPNLSDTHRTFAVSVLLPLGKLQEAEQEMRTAVDLDPISAGTRVVFAYHLVMNGHYDEAIENCRRVLASAPDYPRHSTNPYTLAEQNWAHALMLKGKTTEAVARWEELGLDVSANYLGYVYARSGRRAEAEELAAKYPGNPARQAVIYAGLDDKDRAFAALEKMAANHDARVDYWPFMPELAGLRSDPRMAAFRHKRGLPWNP